MTISKLRQIYETLSKSPLKFSGAGETDITDYSSFRKSCGTTVSETDKFEVRRPTIFVMPNVNIFNFLEYRDFHYQVQDLIGIYPENYFEPQDSPRPGKKVLTLGRLIYNEEIGTATTTVTETNTFERRSTFYDSEDKENDYEPTKKDRTGSITRKLIRSIELITVPNFQIWETGSRGEVRFKDLAKQFPSYKNVLRGLFVK